MSAGLSKRGRDGAPKFPATRPSPKQSCLEV
jgi:hypothetical protein